MLAAVRGTRVNPMDTFVQICNEWYYGKHCENENSKADNVQFFALFGNNIQSIGF